METVDDVTAARQAADAILDSGHATRRKVGEWLRCAINATSPARHTIATTHRHWVPIATEMCDELHQAVLDGRVTVDDEALTDTRLLAHEAWTWPFVRPRDVYWLARHNRYAAARRAVGDLDDAWLYALGVWVSDHHDDAHHEIVAQWPDLEPLAAAALVVSSGRRVDDPAQLEALGGANGRWAMLSRVGEKIAETAARTNTIGKRGRWLRPASWRGHRDAAIGWVAGLYGTHAARVAHELFDEWDASLDALARTAATIVADAA